MEETSTVQASVQPPPEPVAVPPKKKFLNIKWIVLGIIVLVLILISAGATYFFLNSNKQVACTQEAKICPDGSSVGRTGPKCEFSKCPTTTSTSSAETTNWKTYRNEKYGFEFKYPQGWGVVEKYPTPKQVQDWKILFDLTVDPVEVLESPARTLASDLPPYLGILLHTDLTWLDERQLGVKNLDDFITQYSLPVEKEDALVFESVERISFGSQSGFRVKTRPTAFVPDTIYYLQLSEGIMEITPWFRKEAEMNVLLSTFKFTDQTSPTPTCRPRPACLDATPRCMIPETEDMCPPKITPAS